MNNTILDKLEMRCREMAENRWKRMYTEIFRCFRNTIQVSGTSIHEKAVEASITNVLDVHKDFYMDIMISQEQEKFFARFDDISVILTRALLSDMESMP